MTFLVERLAEIQRYLEHLESLRDRVEGPESLAHDFALHNDVLFSLLMIAQMVIDVCGELSTRANLRFGDYTEAVLNLRPIGGYPEPVVRALLKLPGFRNVVIHEYIGIDYGRVVAALNELEPIREFVKLVAWHEQAGGERGPSVAGKAEKE